MAEVMGPRVYTRTELEEAMQIAAEFAFGERGPRQRPLEAVESGLSEFNRRRGERREEIHPDRPHG